MYPLLNGFAKTHRILSLLSLLVLIVFSTNCGNGRQDVPRVSQRSQEFTTSGTWTVPTGVTMVDVIGRGGSGGGAGGGHLAFQQGAGGGGAVSVAAFSVSVSPGQVVAITVGAAGAGGA